jgi:hypothetical protein
VQYYHAFGLKVASELPLPELHPGSGPPEVTITLQRSAIEFASQAPSFTIEPDTSNFHLDGISYTVVGGAQIAIVAPLGSRENDIRVWLLGTVMAALLHQRGYLPIHGNAVQLASGDAVAFVGQSGAGKSTLAALLERAGLRVLCDDLCAIKFDRSNHPMLFAGIPRLKLWGDALHLLGRDHSQFERVASDLMKYHVPLSSASAEGPLNPIPLKRVYLLDRKVSPNEPLFEPLRAAKAAGAILSNAFRWGIGQSIHGERSRIQFDRCLDIARHAAVFRLARTWDPDNLLDESEEIIAALRELA